MKPKIGPLPEPETPHPSEFYKCAEVGHDPNPDVIVGCSRLYLKLRHCMRCGLAFFEEQKSAWPSGEALKKATEEREGQD
jgi:hypothetical protein